MVIYWEHILWAAVTVSCLSISKNLVNNSLTADARKLAPKWSDTSICRIFFKNNFWGTFSTPGMTLPLPSNLWTLPCSYLNPRGTSLSFWDIGCSAISLHLLLVVPPPPNLVWLAGSLEWILPAWNGTCFEPEAHRGPSILADESRGGGESQKEFSGV